MDSPVAGRLQRPGQRRGLRIEEIGLPARPVPGAGLEIAGDPPPGRELPGDQPAPRRRADRRGRIIAGEPHPLFRHPVDVWRRDRAPVTRQVARPEVIREDDDHVGPAVLDAGRAPGVRAASATTTVVRSTVTAIASRGRRITRSLPHRYRDRPGHARWPVDHIVPPRLGPATQATCPPPPTLSAHHTAAVTGLQWTGGFDASAYHRAESDAGPIWQGSEMRRCCRTGRQGQGRGRNCPSKGLGAGRAPAFIVYTL